MNNRWESFEGTQHSRTTRQEPRVTLGLHGVFYLNGIAYRALGEPEAVEMLFDGGRRAIGLKPIDPRERNAFVIKPHGRNGKYKRISASAFCTHYRIHIERTILFDKIDVDGEGVMALDMTRTINVGRGSR